MITRAAVDLEDVPDRCRRTEIQILQRLLYQLHDVRKADRIRKKTCDGDFVSRVEDDRRGPSLFQGVTRHSKRWKAVEVGRLEVQSRDRGKIETLSSRLEPF